MSSLSFLRKGKVTYKLRKKHFGVILNNVILTSICAIQCADAEVKYLSIKDAINRFNQDSWRIIANNKVVDAKKGTWIKEELYNESIVKVIGEAIGKCVTGTEEFADKDEGEAVTFAVTPKEINYSAENWNAVVLYNYLNVLKWHFIKNESCSLPDIFNEVKTIVLGHYKWEYAIDGLEGKIDKAIWDINEYSHALDLYNWMQRFVKIAHNIVDYEYPDLDNFNDSPYITPILEYKSASYYGHTQDWYEWVKDFYRNGNLLEFIKAGSPIGMEQELIPLKVSVEDRTYYINRYSIRWSYVNEKIYKKDFVYNFYNISDHVLDDEERRKLRYGHTDEQKMNFLFNDISGEIIEKIKQKALKIFE